MFHRWGFLLSEIWGLLILAALMGLLVGWLIWGRRVVSAADSAAQDRLRADLDACQSSARVQASRISALEGDVTAAKAAADAAQARLSARAEAASAEALGAGQMSGAPTRSAQASAAEGSAASFLTSAPAPSAGSANGSGSGSGAGAGAGLNGAAAPAAAGAAVTGTAANSAAKAAAKPAAKPAAKAAAKPAAQADAKPAAKPAAAKAKAAAPSAADSAPQAPAKPTTLSAPRGGKADDLKLIKGVGPKMEALLHKLGFYHFDQMAAWTAKDVAWVDENLEDFKGRATREDWVQQAKDLAAGKAPRKGGEN